MNSSEWLCIKAALKTELDDQAVMSAPDKPGYCPACILAYEKVNKDLKKLKQKR